MSNIKFVDDDNKNNEIGIITRVKVLIEQSFSDFGDADIVILTKDSFDNKKAFFIEAKVRVFKKNWNL